MWDRKCDVFVAAFGTVIPENRSEEKKGRKEGSARVLFLLFFYYKRGDIQRRTEITTEKVIVRLEDPQRDIRYQVYSRLLSLSFWSLAVV